jgi:hypothetical protein
VRLFAGAWLTACTYPVVWLVLPPLFEERSLYLLAAETFAPVAEWVDTRTLIVDSKAPAAVPFHPALSVPGRTPLRVISKGFTAS